MLLNFQEDYKRIIARVFGTSIWDNYFSVIMSLININNYKK